MFIRFDIWSTNVKKSPFSRTAAHIFVSPGDAPATSTQYVAWMQGCICQGVGGLDPPHEMADPPHAVEKKVPRGVSFNPSCNPPASIEC